MEIKEIGKDMFPRKINRLEAKIVVNKLMDTKQGCVEIKGASISLRTNLYVEARKHGFKVGTVFKNGSLFVEVLRQLDEEEPIEETYTT